MDLRRHAREIDTVAVDVELFMEAAVLIGSEFLASGGPVTRLESQLAAAGNSVGIVTTVHATPSAISIFCHQPKRNSSNSRAARIESFGVDLGHLRCVDKMLGRFATGEIRPENIIRRLSGIKRRKKEKSIVVHYAALFGIGAGAALLSGGSTSLSFVCGAFTLVNGAIVNLLGRYVSMKPIFADFANCLLAFLLSSLFSSYLEIPAKILSLGTLVYVVPGLLLTTAISEIVDQNYLSGTIRLLKALCTFLAMALAYFLASELAHAFAIDPRAVAAGFAAKASFAGHMTGCALILLSSSLEFGAHEKSLPRIMLCGLAGAACFFAIHTSNNLAIPHFCAAFVIGLVSFWMGRRFRHPSQIYSVPSILILAPGMLAFSSFGYGASEDFSLPSILKAALVSLSIVFGLAAGRLPFFNSNNA